MDLNPRDLPCPESVHAFVPAIWDPKRLMQLVETVLESAIEGEPIIEEGKVVGRHRRCPVAQKLALAYGYGTPIKQQSKNAVTGFDTAHLETLEGCRRAAIELMALETSGAISHEAADAYRKNLDLIIKTHMGAGEDTGRDSTPVQVIVQSYAAPTTEQDS